MLRRPEGDLKPCLWPRCVGYMVPRLRIFVLGRSRIVVRAVISSFGELSLLSLKLRGNHCAGVTYGRAKVKVWNCEIVKAVWRVRDCLYHFQLACLLNRVSEVPFYSVFSCLWFSCWWSVMTAPSRCSSVRTRPMPCFLCWIWDVGGFQTDTCLRRCWKFPAGLSSIKVGLHKLALFEDTEMSTPNQKKWEIVLFFCLGGGYKTPKLWFGIFNNEPSQIINHLEDVFNHPK